MFKIHVGDCLEVMKSMPDSSIDAIVCDPPYGLSFMGKRWDYDVPSVDIWSECLRVLKPGGHLLAFAGTRTQHRMSVRIEDAGFEIRDMIAWVYGSGFPKSRNLDGDWEGWGTALKPALEPITVARKPLVGTVAENVLAHGTGALNIDECRIPTDDKLGGGGEKAQNVGKIHEGFRRPWMNDPVSAQAYAERCRASVLRSECLGRWPANLIHDGSEEVLAAFPSAPGQQGKSSDSQRTRANTYGELSDNGKVYSPRLEADTSAARFFYCAKASKSDRGAGNNHPTVKPTELMRYLCRLITPPGGVVLDPFMGSGSTGKAAIQEGFRFVGIERESGYAEIARSRIEAEAKNKLDSVPVVQQELFEVTE